ncbi:MAG TPA: GNAT family N-acetyltransferase [Gemmatimonadales bacterium]|nr:GNAT family N-acetyltransferase [Gemmatimonadales bacterium]
MDSCGKLTFMTHDPSDVLQVHHDPATHRFQAPVSSGTAVLSYALAGPGLLELYSTYVPAANRGHGVGGRLVEFAVAYAREQGMRIIPTCWYVAQWIREHPEHGDLVVAGPAGQP